MSYYKLLGLDKEPFSTSPDPDFFYQSSGHQSILMRLMVEVRLRRGLSLIIGDVGVGKTTLLRKALQMFGRRSDIISAMILDPIYEHKKAFLADLIKAFKIDLSADKASLVTITECKTAIKNFLFQKGVDETKTVVLLIDEAQKLDFSSLETLRTLLNYETNEYKLLQVILLTQLELVPKLKTIHNLLDRIDLKFTLKSLSREEVGKMIRFRLKAAGCKQANRLFTDNAIQTIYEVTNGFPRKITRLSHQALKTIVMYNLPQVDKNLIQDLTLSESVALDV